MVERHTSGVLYPILAAVAYEVRWAFYLPRGVVDNRVCMNIAGVQDFILECSRTFP